jgi:hypothetical protein
VRLYLVCHAAVTVRPDQPASQWHLSPQGRVATEAFAHEPTACHELWARIRFPDVTVVDPEAQRLKEEFGHHNAPK